MNGKRMVHGRPADYGALEQRVYSVEQGIANLSNQIGGLSTKIDERSRTSWPTLASFGGLLVVVMGGLGALAYRPIETSLVRIEQALPAYISRAEANVAINRIDRDIARLEKTVEQNQNAIVPRSEHQEKWRSNEQALLAIQRQIDDIQKIYGQTYSLRDAFADLKRQVQDLAKERREDKL